MASGKPDYKDDSIISGKFGPAFIPIGVDAAGNMLAVMQGDFGGVLSTIAVDAAGRMIANLGAQDLPHITIAETTGLIRDAVFNHNFAAAGSYRMINVAGSGRIIGGFVKHSTAISHKGCGIHLVLDGHIFQDWSFEDMRTHNLYQDSGHLLRLLEYDDTNFEYKIGFNGGITYGTSFELYLEEVVGISTFSGIFVYTLFP